MLIVPTSQDFINLDFIPAGTDTGPIVPALTNVFDAALAGGGAKSINFQELAADLAEITFEYVSHHVIIRPIEICLNEGESRFSQCSHHLSHYVLVHLSLRSRSRSPHTSL